MLGSREQLGDLHGGACGVALDLGVAANEEHRVPQRGESDADRRHVGEADAARLQAPEVRQVRRSRQPPLGRVERAVVDLGEVAGGERLGCHLAGDVRVLEPLGAAGAEKEQARVRARSGEDAPVTEVDDPPQRRRRPGGRRERPCLRAR